MDISYDLLIAIIGLCLFAKGLLYKPSGIADIEGELWMLSEGVLLLAVGCFCFGKWIG